MSSAFTRRAVASCAVGIVLSPALASAAARSSSANAVPARAVDACAALEARHGGRLGVAALDIGSGRHFGYRAEERFAMCSTHKLLTVAAILRQVDERRLALGQHVPYGRGDLLEYAPITRRNVATGFMTVQALCAAAIEWSDNTAANLLLQLIGGPAGWTRYARSIGDSVSRLDRVEPALNSATPGDKRDTTTPDAMLRELHHVLMGGLLSDASRTRLEGWLRENSITGALLRAGVPEGWRVGDKSGTGEHGTRADIGIILPPARAPILAAVYYTGSAQPAASRDRVIAEVGQIIARSLGT